MLFHADKWPNIRWYFNELCCEHFDPDRRTYMAYESLLRMLFLGLDRCKDISVRKRQPTTSQTIHMVLRYISTNYQDATLQGTAKRFGFSPNHLTYTLKKYTGMGFQALRQNECMEQSARLLRETELTVTQIAQHVGIRNMPHFYALFSEKYGETPAKYRENSRKNAPTP